MANKPAPTFEQLKDEYSKLLGSMTIHPSRVEEIKQEAAQIAAHREAYDAVEKEIGVPWYFTGAIHSLECGLSFKKHLHCGDPLTARTKNVPKGRPKAPPANGKVYTWHESAIDALTLKGLQNITDWSAERVCFEAERYNGWGYRWYRGILSPYLWSCSNHYTRGKYVRDGVWSVKAVSAQIGIIPLIDCLHTMHHAAPTPPDYSNILK